MTTYAGTVRVTSVVCPSWCTVPQQEHLDQLNDWDGRCVHWNRGSVENGGSSEVLDEHGCPIWHVDHAVSTLADGALEDVPEAWPTVHFEGPQVLSLDQAEALGRAILDAVEEARS